jgi:transposase
LTKEIFKEGWYPIPKTEDTMRKPDYPIELSAIERVELEDIVRKGEHKARVIRRAQTLLWSDGGKSDLEIAELHGITPLTVANTRKRWVKERSLEDQPRAGRKPKLDGKQEAFLVALACSDAPDGRESWTMQLLADKLVELQVIDEPISDETVRLLLQKKRSNPG